ncbi:MAG: hypothetical protein JWO69_1307 [Thermoleophilia bacterium]|nr:hypothetical protein [Thermoleophilia bacterium]
MDALETVDRRILSLADRRKGLVEARRLRAAGIGRTSVHRRMAQGRMTLILPRVYYVGPPGAVTSEVRQLAAVLAGGDGATLARESAAVLRGIWSRPSDDFVHVACRRRPHGLARSFARFHERRAPVLSHELVNGVPVDPVEQVCLELGYSLTKYQVAHVIHEAAFRGVLDLEQLSDLASSAPYSRSAKVARDALALYRSGSAGTRSRSEDRFVDALERNGLPIPLVNVSGAAGVGDIEPDFTWRHRRLIIEIDGPGHDRPGMVEADAARDRLLRAAGWQVVRIPASEVWANRPRVLHRVSALLGV